MLRARLLLVWLACLVATACASCPPIPNYFEEVSP